MKKFYSVLSLLLVFALSFTACSKDDNNTPGAEGVKNVTFASETTFSEDLLGLIDVTCTYTGLDGQTKNLEMKNGMFTISDSSTKLPAQVKVAFSAKKSKNYDAFKASKDKFILSIKGPSLAADYVSTNGNTYPAAPHTAANTYLDTFDPSSANFDSVIDAFMTDIIEGLLSFSGTFTAVEGGASFTKGK